jgi:ribose 5-phosphate isomerase B
MRIAVASGHRGFKTKDRILSSVKELGHEAFDFGPSTPDVVDYPDCAAITARAVSGGQVDRAILISGTGIGMSIVANKFIGVRAALCHDDLSAEMSRRHNDANVLCLSTDLLGELLSARMIKIWLETPFEGGRHARRIAKIIQIERDIYQ